MDMAEPRKGTNRRKIQGTADKIVDRKTENMDGFMRRKEQSKEDIRKAARELFSQFGIGKVSIVDLAHRAGVSQATIYNNFGSKENLERDFMMTIVDNFVDKAHGILFSDKPYQVKLNVFIQFLESMVKHTPETDPDETDHAEFLANILNDPKIKKMQDEMAGKLVNLILEFISEGKKQGEIRSNISGDALSIFVKSLTGTLFDPELHPRFHRQPELARDVLLLSMYGMLGQRS
jgi:AcrR family transcriptional regulator